MINVFRNFKLIFYSGMGISICLRVLLVVHSFISTVSATSAKCRGVPCSL